MPESDWVKTAKERFYHIARQAEIVVIKDRDVMAFIPEAIALGGTQGMSISRNQGNSVWLYKTAPEVTVQSSERLLLWARLSGTEMVTGPRWVPYVTTSNPDDANIKPLREVYSPRVTFDRTSNMLHLWFWTNVKWDYDGLEYDENQIVPIGFQGYDQFFDVVHSKMTLKRVLCYAVGQLGHYWVQGGLISGFQGAQSVGDQYDIVPIFARPVIVTNYHTAHLTDAPGLVTDGWYGIQGGNGLDGSQGFQGPIGFMGWQGPNGWQGNQGPIGWQGPQGPQGFQGLQGFPGIQGWQGSQGYTGWTGLFGVQGWQGYQGFPGSQGPQGTDGWHGWQGLQGLQGFQGVQGVQGWQGPVGWQGWQGYRGLQGNDGPDGFRGNTGSNGSPGWQGFQGNQGPNGWQGNQGPIGWQGFQGATGYTGYTGGTGWTGYTGWTGLQGWQGWQGFQGLQGFQGWQGWQGYQGWQGFQGLQGLQGIQGLQGLQGWQGWQGYQGIQGLQGEQGPEGDYGWPGPDGYMGSQGSQGPQGDSGVLGPTGWTGWTGWTGYTGWTGNTGPDGPLGYKGAILRFGNEYRALWCLEAPDVWFLDRIKCQINVGSEEFQAASIVCRSYPVDPMFVEACVPDTLEVMSIVPDKPVHIGGVVEGTNLKLIVSEAFSGSIMVWIAGIRRGSDRTYRFKQFSASVEKQNSAFWSGLLQDRR